MVGDIKILLPHQLHQRIGMVCFGYLIVGAASDDKLGNALHGINPVYGRAASETFLQTVGIADKRVE